jgi:hypothetical protein
VVGSTMGDGAKTPRSSLLGDDISISLEARRLYHHDWLNREYLDR